MTMRLTCLALVLVLGAACTQSGSQPAATGQEGTAPAAASSTGSASGAQPAAAATAARSGGRPASPAGTPAVSAATAPAEPPKPQFKEVTISSGTALSVTLDTAVASDTSKVEDPVRGKLAKPIVVDGTMVVPAGAEVVGTVLEANQSGRVKGRASIAFRFEKITVRSETHDIRTARISRQAAATKGDDAKKVGIGAGAGALIGAIAGGGKGAAIGGAVGAGAGTGVVVATRGDEVRLAVGATVGTTLQEPVKVLVRID